MRHLNYNHLQYFWSVANEGSIVAASEVLHLTPQTISGQLKLLEESVGSPLFQRVGRGLVLTDTGRVVKRYADEIFALGGELAQVVRGGESSLQVLHVGILDSIPKLIAYRILQPAFAAQESIRLVCTEGAFEDLLADLAVHRLDLVISDRPIPAGARVKAFTHPLGKSQIAIFAKPAALRRYRNRFPESMDGAPILMPTHGAGLRRELEDWLDRSGIEPRCIAEFDDSALLKVFGAAGAGLFPAPAAIASEIERTYGARVVGVIEEVEESYLAISPERRVKHPVVMSLIERARDQIFVDE
ncbi:MAG: transcriptional activator NhaR [Pseudomonadota bacterium]